MKKLKIFIIAAILLVLLNVYLSLTGTAFGVVNYIDFNVFSVHEGGSKEINGIWIQPVLFEEERTISFFPFFGYHYIGPPYKIGLRAMDYGDINKCKKMEILELSLRRGNSLLQVVKKDTPVVAAGFKKYLKDADINHRDAKWIVPAGEWLDKTNGQENIIFKAAYKIYKNDGEFEGEIKTIFKPQNDARILTFDKLSY
jgi:hypothetical protein